MPGIFLQALKLAMTLEQMHEQDDSDKEVSS